MKRTFALLVLSASLSFAYGQRSVDALFKKYSTDDGFTSLTLNGNLLKLVSSCQSDSDEGGRWMGKITEIRILAQEDKERRIENFYEKVMKDINLNDYEEFMRVRKTNQDLRMLVRSDGGVFREFLLIGGGDDNLIIQVKGKMSYSDARDFSSQVRKEHGREMISNIN